MVTVVWRIAHLARMRPSALPSSSKSRLHRTREQFCIVAADSDYNVKSWFRISNARIETPLRELITECSLDALVPVLRHSCLLAAITSTYCPHSPLENIRRVSPLHWLMQSWIPDPPLQQLRTVVCPNGNEPDRLLSPCAKSSKRT